MKRIALFCDGTWNTPDKMEDGKYCQTNVVKMANALSSYSTDGRVQLLYYDVGIGSEGGIFRRLFDGATGYGISNNILQAYRFLIKNYEPDDEIFLFGFSRGAYTVRSLAGLIRNSGILKPENIDKVLQAYKIYRSKRPELHPKEFESVLFRKTFSFGEYTPIKFIGVWDTVGALGNPLFLNGIFKSNQFHDTELSSRVRFAFQALAIDEKRKNFRPTLWHQQPESKDQVLEQVWFQGVHSDVGGGYPVNQSGLSDIALDWMHDKAKGCGLRFGDLNLSENYMAKKHESYSGFYKIIPPYIRVIEKERSLSGKEYNPIHFTVLKRYIEDVSYRPKNLVDYYSQNPP